LETSAKLFSAAGIHTEVGVVQNWLYVIDDSLLIDLAACRPHALLLFAYYLIYWAVLERKFWFMRNWSLQVMTKIEKILTGQPEFLEMLDWPKQSVIEILK
jgi:hypothetical protein